MTVKQAKAHPAYERAALWAKGHGFCGGMDSMDFGNAVIAYLSGYNRAKKEWKYSRTWSQESDQEM